MLKFPHDEVIGGAAVFERSRRKAEIGKRLSHPGVQRHLNQGEQRSTEYLVLEYLRGRTLRELLMERAPTPLSAHEVLPMLLPVCEALVLAF